MAAAIKNLVIEQKATFKSHMTYKNKSGKAIDLTGFTAAMQIKDAAGALICDLSTGNSKIILGGVTGTIDLIVSAALTSAMTFTTAAYDLMLIAPDGTKARLLQGKVTLSPGTTA